MSFATKELSLILTVTRLPHGRHGVPCVTILLQVSGMYVGEGGGEWRGVLVWFSVVKINMTQSNIGTLGVS